MFFGGWLHAGRLMKVLIRGEMIKPKAGYTLTIYIWFIVVVITTVAEIHPREQLFTGRSVRSKLDSTADATAGD